MDNGFYIGVDPARRQDFTGLTVMSVDDEMLAYLDMVDKALHPERYGPRHYPGAPLDAELKAKRLQALSHQRPQKYGIILRNALRLPKHGDTGLDWDVQAEIVNELITGTPALR